VQEIVLRERGADDENERKIKYAFAVRKSKIGVNESIGIGDALTTDTMSDRTL
jgi:hypothetical protein